MIPVGYMAKRICARPEWLRTESVDDICSVSGCMSTYFADYIGYWKHNGYWFFDTPEVILDLGREHRIDLKETTLFFYEVHEFEFIEPDNEWTAFAPEASIPTLVVPPPARILEGYDVVTFSMHNQPECSPLSCNALASELETNRHCLLRSFDSAKQLLSDGRFRNTEPGPYRIFSVYSTDWPAPA